jgi:hypothetical protein
MRHPLALLLIALVAAFTPGSLAQIRIATFDIDATPPVGSELAYDPVKRHDEISLRCRGIAILGSREPIVLCAIDWIGIANASHDVFREALAEAAGTTRERVAVHALHQHDAPRSDFSSEAIIQEFGIRDYNLFDSFFQRQVIHRAALALKGAIAEAQPVTHYGWGTAEVENVVSNRRILGPDGKVRVMRFTTARDPLIRAEPVGVVDPEISLISLWNNDEPVAVLSYFATHPQSYYRTGIPSPDFPGIARFLRGQGQPKALHVHFNGAGGNIGAGKYNDGNTENRVLLAQRLADGMLAAWEVTEKFPLTPSKIGWKSEPVALPLAKHLDEKALMAKIDTRSSDGYEAITQLAYLRRVKSGHRIDIACLSIGDARVLHMPGELFVEYQLAAKAMRPDLQVAMAAYGDYGTAYIGTEISYEEGGYETSERATNAGPKSEGVLMKVMRQLLETN